MKNLTTKIKRPLSCGYCFGQALLLAGLILGTLGCGTNQFQQEVKTEAAAIKLARETVNGEYTLISTEELQKRLAEQTDVLLVDAMPAAASYDKEHLAGAVNFEFPKDPMEAWDKSGTAGKTLADYEALLGPDKDRQIIVYCGFVKCARSHNAAIYAQQLGYTNVVRYAGGIYAWKGAGHPLTTSP